MIWKISKQLRILNQLCWDPNATKQYKIQYAQQHQDKSQHFWNRVKNFLATSFIDTFGKESTMVMMKIDPSLLWNTEAGCWWFGKFGQNWWQKLYISSGDLPFYNLQQRKVKVLSLLTLASLSLWGDLKCAVHARQSKNLQKLETFCQEERSVLSGEKIKCLSTTKTKYFSLSLMLQEAIHSNILGYIHFFIRVIWVFSVLIMM